MIKLIKFWLSILLINLLFITPTYSNSLLTTNMQKFLYLAGSKNGDQKGFDREDAAKILGVTFERKGSNYYSTERINDNSEQSIFEYSVNNGRRYLTFYFTEPLKDFDLAINKLRGFKPFLIDRSQINGLPVNYFEGESPSRYIQTRKLWIRIYECSDKPTENCLRKAQLIFGQSI